MQNILSLEVSVLIPVSIHICISSVESGINTPYPNPTEQGSKLAVASGSICQWIPVFASKKKTNQQQVASGYFFFLIKWTLHWMILLTESKSAHAKLLYFMEVGTSRVILYSSEKSGINMEISNSCTAYSIFSYVFQLFMWYHYVT